MGDKEKQIHTTHVTAKESAPYQERQSQMIALSQPRVLISHRQGIEPATYSLRGTSYAPSTVGRRLKWRLLKEGGEHKKELKPS